MPEADNVTRVQALEDHAFKVEEGIYYRELSELERAERNDLLVDTCVNLSKKDEEKKDFMDTWKAEVKPMIEMRNVLVNELKTGQVECNGKQYFIPNYEERRMEIYDSAGLLVSTRNLMPNERQGVIGSRMFLPGDSKTGS